MQGPDMLQRAGKVHRVRQGSAEGCQASSAASAQAEPSLLHGPQEVTTHVQVAGCIEEPQWKQQPSRLHPPSVPYLRDTAAHLLEKVVEGALECLSILPRAKSLPCSRAPRRSLRRNEAPLRQLLQLVARPDQVTHKVPVKARLLQQLEAHADIDVCWQKREKDEQSGRWEHLLETGAARHIKARTKCLSKHVSCRAGPPFRGSLGACQKQESFSFAPLLLAL